MKFHKHHRLVRHTIQFQGRQRQKCQGYYKSFKGVIELLVPPKSCQGRHRSVVDKTNELEVTKNFQNTIYVSGPSAKNQAYYIEITKGMSDKLQTCRGHQRHVVDTRYVAGVKEKCIGHSRNVSNTTD